MPDVRVTVDGQVVFARDCTDFQLNALGNRFEAHGSFAPVEHYGYPVAAGPNGGTGIQLDGLLKEFGFDGVFKDPNVG